MKPKGDVIYELSDNVAWLTINRPEAQNTLSASVGAGLSEGIRRFIDDASAKVLVLTGTGDAAFCAGGDLLKEMTYVGPEVPPPSLLPQVGRNEVPKPVIAAINGVAYAEGFFLAQCCDLCIAADSARFAISEINGVRDAPWAAPVPWCIPPQTAVEMMLAGDSIDASRAYELGFVNSVVPRAELQETVQREAVRIAANAPLFLAAKRTVRLLTELPLTDAYVEAERLWEAVYLSQDAPAGPVAIRDDRAPNWKGR
jgi:enoyl-CoA hydratase/carnithine racemase